MGNFWKGISKETLDECENQLMLRNGLPRDAYTINNINLDQDYSDPDSQNYIHEVHVKGTKPNLPKIVLIHGYLSGSV